VDAVRRGLGLPFAAPLPSPEGREGGAAVAGPQYGVQLLMARTPEHYREEAERCRKMAQDILEADTRANLLDVARQYDNLAEEAAAKQ